MKRKFTLLLIVLAVAIMQHASAVLVNYSGSNGLSATADFTLSNGGSTLNILLTNTSNVAAMTVAGINGDANMVLSSLNITLSPALITGGTVALGAGSNAVISTNTSAWANFGGSYDLDDEFGYSNTGVGNTPGPLMIGALGAVTSHSNGGNAVTTFDGVVGGVGNGLNWGLVATGSSDIGNNRQFVMNSVQITLNLNQALANLNFLNLANYVEFGSDYQYVPGVPDFPDDEEDPIIPEPATLGLIGLGLGMAGVIRRRRR